MSRPLVTTDHDAHAVAQTLAAERLEGWAPTAEHVAALQALVREEVSFADYFAPFRARYPTPERRRRRPALRRPAPYLIPGTTLLRNRFGMVDAESLADLEFVTTAGRMATWLAGASAATDVQVLHGHLFADVYSWAGTYRITELRRGEQGFAWVSTIATRMASVHDAAQAVVAAGAGYDGARLEYELARLYADFNQVHPFREGNGRTGALLLHGVAAGCGRTLDLSGIKRTHWYAAAADSMPFRRDGRASHRPYLYLLSGRTSRNSFAPTRMQD